MTTPTRVATHETELPVLGTQAKSTLARELLMKAQKHRLVNYRWPLTITDPEHVYNLTSELGEDAVLPRDPAVTYYFFYVVDQHGVPTQPMVLRESDVPGFVLGLAASRDRETLLALQYRVGEIPR